MDSISVPRPAGAILVDGQQVADTQQCCHCSQHFVMVRGSGKRRGLCLRCKKITCGAPGCDVCIPAEARLEIAEGVQKTIERYKGLLIG